MSGDDATPAKRSCGRVLFRVFLALFVVGVLLAAAAGVGGYLIYQHVTQPGTAREDVAVSIPEGATGNVVARELADQGLVEHEAFFRLAIRLDKSGKSIKHGTYTLQRGLSPVELLHLLQEGPNRTPEASEIPPDRKVTIPEGLSLAQMAQLFQNPQAFLDAASDPALLARVGLAHGNKDPKTLEGFLMPSTYFFDKKPSEREVVERMVDQFVKDYAALTAECQPPAGFDLLAVLTVASLVEEEAKVDAERPNIAAVIYNRLKKKMPLQLDSTLQYSLKKYGQRLLYEDLQTDSPYNTYKHQGLPPGPISSPGKAAIRAALRPANADYLYFVSNADGHTHTFSSTEAEHLKAVAKFRKEIAPQRKAAQ